MAVLEDVKGIAKEALGEITKRGEYSASDFEIMHHATGIIKDIKEICNDENKYMEDYSGRNARYYGNNYSGGMNYPMYQPMYNEYSYDGGSGYSSGNRMYPMNNRNSMGRYTSNGGYSRGQMYSGSDDTSARMVEKLERMLDENCTENEREAIKSCINKISR